MSELWGQGRCGVACCRGAVGGARKRKGLSEWPRALSPAPGLLLPAQPGPQVWDKPKSSKKPKMGVPGPGSCAGSAIPCHGLGSGTSTPSFFIYQMGWAAGLVTECREAPGERQLRAQGLALPPILAKVGLPPCPGLRWVMDSLHNTTLRAWGPQSSTTFILISDAGASIVDVPHLHPPSVGASRLEWGGACPSRGWTPQRPP